MAKKKQLSVGAAMAALRMVRMSPEERSKVARNAVNARWARYRAAQNSVKAKPRKAKAARKPAPRKAA